MKYILIFANALIIGLALFTYRLFPPEVPLFYTYSWGEDRLAHPLNLLFVPLLMNVSYALIRHVTHAYYHDDAFIRKIATVAQMVCIVLSLIIWIRTIVLVI